MKHDPILTRKRKPVNVSVDIGVIAAARAVGLNLSRVAEDALRSAIKAEQERRWVEEHREAIEGWNRWYEKNGDPLEGLRVR